MGTPVDIVPHDANWADAFSTIEQRLRHMLGAKAASIDHIGSTAVPGLAAKPFIDIDVTLSDIAEMDACRVLMQDAGYEPRGSRHGDGVWAFMIRNPLPGQRVYLCPPDSNTHRDRMIFRNTLRNHSDLAAEYAALKGQLAAQYPCDGDAYTAAKTLFIAKVLRHT